MLLIFLFSISLTLTSIWRLYIHFKDLGVPDSLGDVFNSYVLVSVYLLIIGVGLLRARAWARVFAIGLCISGLLAALGFFIYSGLNFRLLMLGGWLFFQAFQRYAVFVNNTFTMIATLVISLIFSLAILGLLFKVLVSQKAKAHFGESTWFGFDPRFKDYDLKPLLPAGLFLLLHFFDSLVPRSFLEKTNNKSFAVAQKAFVKELEKDPTYIEDQRKRKEANLKQADDKRSAAWIDFTLDESKAWLATADNKIHLYDFKSYSSKVFEAKVNRHSMKNYLAWDGSYFYQEELNSVIKTSDKSAIVLPNKDTFLGFANPTSHVVLFDSRQRKLYRYDFVDKKEVWAKVVDNDFKIYSYIWNLNRSFLFGGEKQFYTVNVETGEFTPHELKMRYAEFSFHDPVNQTLFVSGPIAFGSEYSSYKIEKNAGELTQLETQLPLTDYNSQLKSFISYRFNELKLIPESLVESEIKKIPMSYSLRFFISQNGQAALLVGSNQEQMEVFDMAKPSKKLVGRVFSKDRPVENSVCQSKSSVTNRLALVICRQNAELFWLNNLLDAKPVSWAFNVPIGEVR